MAFRRLALGLLTLIGLLGAPGVAPAQITWQHNYADTGTGVGFDSASVGVYRRASAVAATDYLSTVLDGRGTVSLQWDQSFTGTNNPGFLARFGAEGYGGVFGSFQNGNVYQAARTNVAPFGTPHGSGQVNFSNPIDWHYAVPGSPTTLAGSFDLVSTLVHEVTHSLGFASLTIDSTGQGLFGRGAGNTDVYGTLDLHLQRGSNLVAPENLFNRDITNPNYGSLIAGRNSALTGGNTQNPQGTVFTNQPTTGLYFGGEYAVEVFGGAVPMYSPSPYSGSSASHVNVGPPGNTTADIGVMNFATPPAVERRLQPYEIAMLLDIGWNVYNWNGSTGNFVTGGNTLATTRWRTDRGIALASDFSAQYNTNANQGQAPILPPYAQVTSNIVLNFGGTTAYTSTNDIGTVRLARLNLDSSASGGGSTITGGTLLFGQNSDGTASVLAPKIVQRGSGAFTIASNIQTINTTGAPGGGHTGLTLDGGSVTVPGGQPTGMVTVSGVISGTGGLTKQGGGNNYTLTGANTYTGATSVLSGTLLVSGSGSFASSPTVHVNNAGTLNVSGVTSGANFNSGRFALATGQTLTGGGAVVGAMEARSGSTISPGNTPGAPGTLNVTGDVVLASGSTFRVNLNGPTHGQQYDRLSVTGAVTLNNATLDAILLGTYSPGDSDTLFILLNDGIDAISGTFLGLGPGATFTLGGFTATISYEANSTNFSTSGGNDVALSFTPVPEPGVVLIAAAGGLGLLRLARRRRGA